MKTNIFNVREKKDKKILIEEEKTKNPLLLFFRRHKKFILLSLILLGICSVLIGISLTLSIFQTSSDFDISFLDGSSSEINSNNDPNIDDDTVTEDLLGEISRTKGVVILTETFMNNKGDVIYYYSDKSSIIILADGKIYRVSSLNDGSYGIDKSGNINKDAKKTLVKSTTSTLQDKTVITYYSDGTAKLEYNNIILFVRDSNNIKLNNGNNLNNIVPSGVAPYNKSFKQSNLSATSFTDNSLEVIVQNQKYLVNKKSNINLTDNIIEYDKNNSFKQLEEKKLSDGNTVTYYENGSAVITDKNNNKIYVKKSGDITIKDNAIYEIITNDYGYSKGSVSCNDAKKVEYFDNGAAIITYSNGTKKYIEDSDEILYDQNKNIKTNPAASEQISEKKTTDGNKVINFDNGKSQVIKQDGTSYITDTDKLIFDTSGNIKEPPKQESSPTENNNNNNENTESNGTGGNTNPIEGVYVSEAENRYNYSKSVEDTNFIIRNTTSKQKKYRIVIEEISDYKKYNTSRLDPQFVKFQATVEDTLVPVTKLNQNTINDENGKVNYLIYDGEIGAKAVIQVAISLYVDYSNLDNSYQNKGFIGTIKVYVNDED